MLPSEPDPIPQSPVHPLVAVIDTCVFPHRKWLDRIRDVAQAGYLVPIWSPLIIAEVTRLLTWRWLRRNQADQTPSAWARCSADSKTWFSLMTAVFRVAEDGPPQEEAWDSPRDKWDLPLWSAAKRCGASFVVTENLKDGPPEDERGLRIFEGVLWCHPEIFLNLLDIWSDFVATGWQELPSTASQERISSALAADVASNRGIDVSEPFLNFLDELFDRSSSTPCLTESSVRGSPDDP